MSRSASKLGVGLVILLSLIACIIVLGPMPLSELLVGATSGSGPEIQGCPSAAGDAPELGDRSTSAEMNRWLREQFPPGTPQVLLVQGLKRQGFHVESSCPRDPSIRRAYFHSHEKRGLCSGVWARVYWQRDGSDHIVRTWGTVVYDCL